MTYLNQIAADARPTPPKSGLANLFTPKVLAFAIGGIILAIVLIIVGSLLGGVSRKEQTLVEQANLRCTNLLTTIDTYTPELKSPNLRALTASLSSILTETSRNLTTSLQSDFGQDAKATPSESLTQSETDHISALNSTLESARLNGILDRTYLREMELQISLLLSIESEALARTDKPSLTGYLNSSTQSLATLHDQFESFNSTSENTRAL